MPKASDGSSSSPIGTTAVEFATSGAALLRLRLGAEDLAVANPDDTWTLFVHGWQTAGNSVEFELQTRVVPAAAGTGVIASEQAPESASIGAFGTVAASWSGLELAQEYVGAVSHANADGLVGLTIVDITT